MLHRGIPTDIAAQSTAEVTQVDWAGNSIADRQVHSTIRGRVLTLSMAFALAISVGAASGTASAQSGPQQQTFTISPQPVETALKEFARQANIEVLFAGRDVAELASNGVTNATTRNEALTRLLDGTGLVFAFEGEDLLVVRVPAEEVRTQTTAPGLQYAAADASRRNDGYEEKRDEAVDEMIVTGTNIRGVAPESSPMQIYDREDILNSGVSTAQDFIQTLPQNFGGGSNADSGFGSLPNDNSTQFNGAQGGGTFGSSVNLRGLGSGSTLVLLNGHRVAPSSGIGDFVDISMIPASALERIDVLTDGASSIYGGDAVAGVVNFILRDDFDGVEASIRYGSVTEGDLDETRTSITGGKSWNSGNALIVYEYFKQDDLGAEDRAFSQGATLPHDLLPSQERHSVLASISQDLNANLEMYADFLYSKRETQKDLTDNGGNFVSSITPSEYLSFSVGGSWEISDGWFADFSGTYSDLHNESNSFSIFPIIREVDSDIWTADAKASGPLFRLPGGDLMLALGGHYRGEAFTNFRVDTDTTDREADRDVYAFFGEAFIPIVGSANAVPGIERLEVNLSGRFDDYSDFGSTSNPKVGLLWGPFDGLNLRGSYSTSFNPPPLGRVGATDYIALVTSKLLFDAIFGLTPGDPSIADVTMITVLGTDKDLDAENSTTYTVGLDFDEQWGRHDLTFSTTWFDIEFENRLGSTPVPGNVTFFDAPNIAFSNPELFPAGSVVFFPSQTEISGLINSVDNVFSAPGLDPLNAAIINFVPVVRNLAHTSVSGFDFDIAYTFEADVGTLSLGLNGTYLAEFKQQGSDTTPIVEQVDTLYSPLGLKLRGRAGYAHNGIVANVFVNYTNDYRVSNTAGAMRIDSWMTVDASLSYDTQEKYGNSTMNNMVLRLSVLNLFNTDPPSTPSNPSFGIFGFDPTNASPLGRFISIELTKRF